MQSVVVEGKVYVGGGNSDSNKNKQLVMEYDIPSGKWTKLPPYKAHKFAMTSINGQLLLVGGVELFCKSSALGVWRAQYREWIHPYPNLPTPRHSCSAVSYKEWLIVAGGYSEADQYQMSIDILNTRNQQWHTAPPMPRGWSDMKTATIGDMWYLMGGYTVSHTDKMYTVFLPALLSQLLNPRRSDNGQVWNELMGPGTTRSAPLVISESLFAIGGGRDSECTSSIQLYQQDTKTWLKVGELPSPRFDCIATMISDRRVLLLGGTKGGVLINRTDIGSLK